MDWRSSLRRQPASVLSSRTGHGFQATCLQDRYCGSLLFLRSGSLNRQHHGSGGPDRLITVMEE